MGNPGVCLSGLQVDAGKNRKKVLPPLVTYILFGFVNQQAAADGRSRLAYVVSIAFDIC
jgi:hypothetical protein